ncbi:BT_3987 domain-containing protein [Deminuibacter soli]|uniref:DUF1735 domain-containing protein n=1 Tax=Deminuibacter soli TaxID=2291815 RepID=A0A3E1NM76_9BACT|nr:DUF1735 domain-containing protein [Deminuibacter soli]RFM29033.1 DUF1735 domain-containing protein [Deminuibacter soli]
MHNKPFYHSILVAALVCGIAGAGCKDTFDLPSQPVENYTKIYMPEAVNGPVTSVFKITDSIQTLTYGANYGGQDFPAADVPVSFTVNNALVDSFNTAKHTSYAALPAKSFTLSATTAVIPKGQVSTPPLSISFITKGPGAMDALKTYLLPISITSTSVKVNEALRTTFYVVKAQPDLKDYPNYDRANWKVIDFSSQEANGEGPNNGRVIFALDGDAATFWHTQWQNGSPGPPHYFTIDMGEQQTLHGFSFLDRQGDQTGKPNEVDIQVSTDNLAWTDAGIINLQNTKDLQPVFLPNGFKEARYFKVIVNSAYGASFTHLAELNAF